VPVKSADLSPLVRNVKQARQDLPVKDKYKPLKTQHFSDHNYYKNRRLYNKSTRIKQSNNASHSLLRTARGNNTAGNSLSTPVATGKEYSFFAASSKKPSNNSSIRSAQIRRTVQLNYPYIYQNPVSVSSLNLYGADQNSNIKLYLNEIQDLLYDNWKPERIFGLDKGKYLVKIYFTLDRYGRVQDFHFIKPSINSRTNAEIDRVIYNTVFIRPPYDEPIHMVARFIFSRGFNQTNKSVLVDLYNKEKNARRGVTRTKISKAELKLRRCKNALIKDIKSNLDLDFTDKVLVKIALDEADQLENARIKSIPDNVFIENRIRTIIENFDFRNYQLETPLELRFALRDV
jgi:hypothetical protein